jgi:threonine/homoserine/homoserine lactone efflux protein
VARRIVVQQIAVHRDSGGKDLIGLVASGIALGLSVAAPIGPVNIAVIRRGLVSGFFAAWMLGLGAAAADTFYVILVFLGLAPVLAESIPFRLALWIIGGMFLIYLGATSARPTGVLDSIAPSAPRVELHPFLTGLGMTLLNPMTIVSWLAIGGAFFSSIALVERGVSGSFFVGGIFAGSALWFSSIAISLHFARRWVNDRAMRIISLVASVVLIGFGLGFIFQAVRTFL